MMILRANNYNTWKVPWGHMTSVMQQKGIGCCYLKTYLN